MVGLDSEQGPLKVWLMGGEGEEFGEGRECDFREEMVQISSEYFSFDVISLLGGLMHQ